MKTKHNGNYELPSVTILLTYRDFPSNSFKDYKVLKKNTHIQIDRKRNVIWHMLFTFVFLLTCGLTFQSMFKWLQDTLY